MSKYDDLAKLASLKQAGVLTEDEFNQQKAILLAKVEDSSALSVISQPSTFCKLWTLLWLVFGGKLGLYQFYTKRWIFGGAMLATSVILAIISWPIFQTILDNTDMWPSSEDFDVSLWIEMGLQYHVRLVVLFMVSSLLDLWIFVDFIKVVTGRFVDGLGHTLKKWL